MFTQSDAMFKIWILMHCKLVPTICKILFLCFGFGFYSSSCRLSTYLEMENFFFSAFEREAGSSWISAIRPALGAALDYSHIRPPTQNNNKQLSTRRSLRPALGRLDDYGSWHWRFGSNVHLPSPLRSEIDSSVSVIPPISRIFDISLSHVLSLSLELLFIT